ncbi:glycoside hydrolase family 97 protein [Cellvibrio sp. NN19]|uniref:glycoside hydrolase family 97 protein n=1 Tax=Cellvibrio chitinivorans TaxID=3102792 RepID=UPI002B40C5AA|nr:glycoside hydrolase family 97 protein [Cellvibrio sp. NN19]
MKKIVMVFFASLISSVAAAQTPAASISSPGQTLEVNFYLSDAGAPSYKVNYKGNELVADSRLGFALKNQADLASGFKMVSAKASRFDQTWEQPWGEERFIRNHYNQLRVALREASGAKRKLDVVFRVYDDGVGFRYEFPEQKSLQSLEILHELTEFNMTADHAAWWTPAQAGNQYEYLYQHTPISKMGLVHTPVTLKTASGVYVALHEAALHNYSTMNVTGGAGGKISATLVPISKNMPTAVRIDAPAVTPWRTLQVEDSAADLITNYLTLNLNEPNKLGDVSWIKPAKYVGIWWELHLEKTSWKSGEKHGATTANTKKYIDFAAKHGFAGVLVEGWNKGWDGEWWLPGGGNAFNFYTPTPDFDVAELSRYAQQKGVYIIGHHETGAAIENYESQLEDAFAFLERYGMKAVKTGYVETGEELVNGLYHHGQFYVNHAQRVIDIAAKHKVAVVAHETVKDTGERRTYPNIISREVARGQEYDAWSADGGNPPSHTAIIPFTRLLSGPMDFTPGAFELTLPSRPNNQVNTTLAKQLALYVVIYSPVQMASDLPEHYEQHLDAFQFIKDVAVDWETTRPLAGEIGEYVAIARKARDSSNWFVGALTNENARKLEIKLDFLEAGKKYTARIYQDGKDAHYAKNPGSYGIKEMDVTAGDAISLQLAPGGGAAISLVAR